MFDPDAPLGPGHGHNDASVGILKLEKKPRNFVSNSALNISRFHQCPGLPYIICLKLSIIMIMKSLLGTNPYQTLAALFFGFILFRQLNKLRRLNPKVLPLPPGLKGYPLIGSLLDMPLDKPWIVYDK